MSTPPPEPPAGGSPEYPTNPYGAPPAPPANPYGAPAYGQPPQPYSFAPWPSRAMAGWSLGLAIAFCIPLATFVSIGLAIAVLVKGRDGTDRGRGMAIAALVIDVMIIVLGIGFVALGLLVDSTPDRDPTGQVTSSQDVSVFTIREGDCVNDDSLFGADFGDTTQETTNVEVVPCVGAHQMEAYLVFDLPDGDFPGTASLTDSAQTRCGETYRDFIGRAPARSALSVFYYVPTQETWDRADDRAITCLVGDPPDETTGTLRDSKR